jgi:transglutaminase-like putative cysteine protease
MSDTTSRSDATVALRVLHETVYQYESPVSQAFHLTCLRLAHTEHQKLVEQDIVIAPATGDHRQFDDSFGNQRDMFSYASEHERLVIRSSAIVDLSPRPKRDDARSLPWEQVVESLRYTSGTRHAREAEFAFASPYIPTGRASFARNVSTYACGSFKPGRPVVEAMTDLMNRIHEDFEFQSGATTVRTTAQESFELRRGVCQDLAHVMIAALRSIGLAARYVSGYLLTQPPPGKPRLIGADASHAWVAAWCPPFGWVEFDPTNACEAGTSHVTIATGRDYSDVPPVRGVIRGGGDHQLKVAVTVAPLADKLDFGPALAPLA